MRRLVYCFDGTWNDDTGENPLTNVVKLHRAVLPVDANGVEQLSRYIVGIATSYTGQTQFIIGALGVEVGKRVMAAYRELMEDYQPGDEIYLFGFSRGAFEARSLANFIAMFGVGCKDKGFSVEAAWALYRRHRSIQLRATMRDLRATSHYPIRTKCVGVWDTVGNIGNPLLPHGVLTRSLMYHDAHLPHTLEVGLQALSVDENRGPFSPTLWTLKKGADLAPGQHIEQVWFAGSHADVGGGYEETALSDIGLLWMTERATATTGLAFDVDRLRRETRPDPLGVQHLSAHGRIFGWSKVLPFVRFIKQDTRPLSGLRRSLLGFWRTDKLAPDEMSLNESLHESVVQRFGQRVTQMEGAKARDAVYRPANVAAVLENAS